MPLYSSFIRFNSDANALKGLLDQSRTRNPTAGANQGTQLKRIKETQTPRKALRDIPQKGWEGDFYPCNKGLINYMFVTSLDLMAEKKPFLS